MRMSIDPGLDGTGFAMWDEEWWNKKVQPFDEGIIHSKTKTTDENWHKRAGEIAGALDRLAGSGYDGAITHVYLEMPQPFQSATGRVASRTGDVIKLTYLVGMIDYALQSAGCIVKPVEVNTWKGQLNKKQVIDRIYERLGVKYSSHAADAVGLGLFCKGYPFEGANPWPRKPLSVTR